jgi:biopolymer transport protein ExbD
MVRFLIYLLETGICLTLFYLAYWLFLRKETYFNFNRLFLVGSIILALAVPLLHISIIVPQGSSFEPSARGVLQFRHGYQEWIRYLDADFGTEPGSRHSTGGGSIGDGVEEGSILPAGSGHMREPYENQKGNGRSRTRRDYSISGIFFIIYISGVVYFFARFVYLVIRLYLLAKRNRVTRQDGFRMVEIDEEISPFSFFRFLFIHNGSFNDAELLHVLEHEKAHIRQRHTTDHLIAHGLAVFQWFNPFAWQMRKALKTTHEYIADRQVIEMGIERIDYQSLLLRQVIGYHSAELVNNFNLKPIKNRIAMMNKTKSGLPAKLKAILVAPIAMIIFFLFADFTVNGTEFPDPTMSSEIQGLWIEQTDDDFSPYLLISGDQFSYAEGVEIRSFNLRIRGDKLILSMTPGPSETILKYECTGDRLTLWWNDARSSRYIRSGEENTLDYLLSESGLQMDLPSISQYRLLEDESRFFRLSIEKKPNGKVLLAFDGEPVTIDKLEGRVQKERMKLNKIDQPYLTALFLVDRKVPMTEVDKVRGELRKMGALHIAEGGYPQGDLDLSPLIYHAVALPRLLPPLHVKVLDKEELKKTGVPLYTIDLSARNTTPGDVDQGLKQFIGNNEDGKYVISLEYDGAIPYGQYVEAVDMVWKIVYSYRNKLAMERYSLPYEQLGEDLQREIRKAFPMALSEMMKS